jgi:pectinesterase inhibitor-like protein
MASSLTSRNNVTRVFVLLSMILAAADQVAGEPPSVVPPACDAAYAVGKGVFTIDFCLSALEGHSVGAADFADLVPFAVNLTTANATATKSKLDAMVAGGVGDDAALFNGLKECQGVYDNVLRLLPECYDAVSHSRYGDARPCLSRAAEAAGACEERLGQGKVASPVAEDDDNLAKLANLAIALTIVA